MDAIAVYDPKRLDAKKICDELLNQSRADFSSAADYQEGSQLEGLVRDIIDKIVIKNKSN